MPVSATATAAVCVAIFGVHYPGLKEYHIGISDGTSSGTELIYKVHENSIGAFNFTNAGKRVVFENGDPRSGRELWVTDGTKNGTRLLKDIYRGATFSSDPSPKIGSNSFASSKNLAIFPATDNNNGRELWSTDGTAEGTTIVKDLLIGEASGIGITDKYVVSNGEKTYFRSRETTFGLSLWSTTGTSKSTRIASNDGLNMNALSGSAMLKNSLIFSYGRQLWITEGTEKSAQMIHEIEGLGNFSNLTHQTDGRFVLFGSDTDQHGREPWVTDGTADGTKLLKNLVPFDGNSDPGDWYDGGGFTVFSAIADGKGRELWVTKGNEKSTKLLMDVNKGPLGSIFYGFAKVGKSVVFVARVVEDIGSYNRLFATDGTPKGTKQLSSRAVVAPGQIQSLGKSAVYIDARDGELWSTGLGFNRQKKVSNFGNKGGRREMFSIVYMTTVNLYQRGSKARPCP